MSANTFLRLLVESSVGRLDNGNSALLWVRRSSHSWRVRVMRTVYVHLVTPLTSDNLRPAILDESSLATVLCAKSELTPVGANRAEVGQTKRLNSLVGA
jgi:hypothetical protein